MLIIKTLKDKTGGTAMIQDTIAGRIYTPKRPFLVEWNTYIETFVNSQSTGVQGGGAYHRKPQLGILATDSDCEKLAPTATDEKLHEDWVSYLNEVRKKAGGGRDGQKAVDALKDEDWKAWAQDWVKQNSGKAAAKPEPTPAKSDNSDATGAKAAGNK